MKNKLQALIIGLFVISSVANAQEVAKEPVVVKPKKGSLYITWGYNKDWFSNSDLHFGNNNQDQYDFTLYNTKAHDKPGFQDILVADLSIPQYMYRLGYYFNDKHDLGIEINFDHVKYVMDDYQTVRMKGTIRGQSFDKDTMVTPAFLKFEHTNGANFLMANLLKRHKLISSANQRHVLGAVMKIGAGIVVPKTDVTLFGERRDNCFHVAGYVFGLDLGFRYDLFKYFFIESSIKWAYADYNKVLTVNGGMANHTFFAQELLLGAGLQIPL